MKEHTKPNLKDQLEIIVESETQLFSHEATLWKGKGGQKVNKTSSTIYTKYDFHASWVLTQKQKQTIIDYLDSSSTYRSKDMKLQVRTQEGRQQLKNKLWWIRKIKELLYDILFEQPRRNLSTWEIRALKKKKTTSLSAEENQRLSRVKKMENQKWASKQKNKTKKMKQSQKKKNRGNKNFDE